MPSLFPKLTLGHLKSQLKAWDSTTGDYGTREIKSIERNGKVFLPSRAEIGPEPMGNLGRREDMVSYVLPSVWLKQHTG